MGAGGVRGAGSGGAPFSSPMTLEPRKPLPLPLVKWYNIGMTYRIYIPESAIARHVAERLDLEMGRALHHRVHVGLLKYGQVLDDNHQEQRAKMVHLVQEGLDAAQYAAWGGEGGEMEEQVAMVNRIARKYRLTAHDIAQGGKH